MAMNQVEQDDLNSGIELLSKEAATWKRTGEKSEDFVEGLRYATRKLKNVLKWAGTGRISKELEESRRPRGRPPGTPNKTAATKQPAKKVGAVKKVPRGQTRFDTPSKTAAKKAPAKKSATVTNITSAKKAKKASAKKVAAR